MKTTSPIAALFGKSPFGPLKEHMRIVAACSAELEPLFRALVAGDHDEVQRRKERIFELEHEADEIKNELRSHLPRHLFMPVDRRDLLHLLGAQDSIADRAQDIAAVLVLRRMAIPEFLHASVPALVERVNEAVTKAAEVINGLDELLESGFRGAEIDRCEVMIRDLSRIESDTDTLGLAILGQLFDHESEMSPLRAMYWQRVVQLIGRIADHAENVGDRLRLLIAR